MAYHPIHIAALGGDLHRVARYLEQDPSLLHVHSDLEMYPLHMAAYEGHVGVVGHLVECGADLGVRNRYGNTALWLACTGGHTQVASLLLSRGASPSMASIRGYTPLMQASRGGHLDVVRVLLRHECVDVDAVDSWGQTALSKACFWGRTEVVRALLEAGADPLAEDEDGHSPLHIAMDEMHHDCVRLMQECETEYVLCKARRLRDASHAFPLPPPPQTPTLPSSSPPTPPSAATHAPTVAAMAAAASNQPTAVDNEPQPSNCLMPTTTPAPTPAAQMWPLFICPTNNNTTSTAMACAVSAEKAENPRAVVQCAPMAVPVVEVAGLGEGEEQEQARGRKRTRDQISSSPSSSSSASVGVVRHVLCDLKPELFLELLQHNNTRTTSNTTTITTSSINSNNNILGGPAALSANHSAAAAAASSAGRHS